MYDSIIKNGNIVDGTGKPVFQGDIAVTDGVIVKIAAHIDAEAYHHIDAEGKYVCPGFIDSHAHTDVLLPYCPNAAGKIMQGVTTDVSGLCGTSIHPLPQGAFRRDALTYSDSFLPQGIESHEYTQPFSTFEPVLTTNMPMFIGQGTLRIAVMGFADRKASADELNSMKCILRTCMEEGAFGLSSGLSYIPGAFTPTEELIALCRELVPFHGIYNTHMRNESNHVVPAVKEVIRIGRESGCRVHISHHKVMGTQNRGKTKETLALIEAANTSGIEVTCDMYPYTAGSIGITSLVPPWVFANGSAAAMKYLHIPATRQRILSELDQTDWENVVLSNGFEQIIVSFGKHCEMYEGMTLQQIADFNHISPKESILHVLKRCEGIGTIVFHSLAEEDVSRVLNYRLCTVGTDAYARPYTGILSAGRPHPRNYSGFIHYLKKYIFEDSLFTLEEGIKKITSLPAHIFELGKRGILKEGYIADITIWDPRTLDEVGTFLDPVHQPKGIDYVLINGKCVVDQGVFTGILEGRMLRHHV